MLLVLLLFLLRLPPCPPCSGRQVLLAPLLNPPRRRLTRPVPSSLNESCLPANSSIPTTRRTTTRTHTSVRGKETLEVVEEEED